MVVVMTMMQMMQQFMSNITCALHGGVPCPSIDSANCILIHCILLYCIVFYFILSYFIVADFYPAPLSNSVRGVLQIE